jgi:hypothetical protein
MSESINVYGLSLWLSGPILETLILFRGFRARWLTRYKFFSAYLFCVLAQDLLFLAFYFIRSKYYAPAYWCAELLCIVLGVGVTWEIFGLTLGRYPGADRMARFVLSIVVVVTISATVAGAWGGHIFTRDSVVELERNLRVAQALSLLVLGIFCLHYRILIGRNLRGLFAGYGIFVGSSVITLTLLSFFREAFYNAWVAVQPLCYLVALVVWCVFLWTYQPDPAEPSPKIEHDYNSLALATRKRVLSARALLMRTLRP